MKVFQAPLPHNLPDSVVLKAAWSDYLKIEKTTNAMAFGKFFLFNTLILLPVLFSFPNTLSVYLSTLLIPIFMALVGMVYWTASLTKTFYSFYFWGVMILIVGITAVFTSHARPSSLFKEISYFSYLFSALQGVFLAKTYSFYWGTIKRA